MDQDVDALARTAGRLGHPARRRRPVRRPGAAARGGLAEGPVDDSGGRGFWIIDENLMGNFEYTVFDCEVPTASCTELGPLAPQGGDPMFIGNDM